MGYFSNATEGDFWESDNCAKCHHNGTGEDDPLCPVMAAHMLYAYEMCNEHENPAKIILDLLIPRNKNELGNAKCAMFKPRHGITDRHLKDWDKYKQLMAEMGK